MFSFLAAGILIGMSFGSFLNGFALGGFFQLGLAGLNFYICRDFIKRNKWIKY